MKNKLFADLKKGLHEAIDFEKGKIDLRTASFVIPDEPPAMSKKKIKELREDVLHMSQPVFASILGVSPQAVKAWEQGEKSPSGTARRLMQLLAKDPKILKMLIGA